MGLMARLGPRRIAALGVVLVLLAGVTSVTLAVIDAGLQEAPHPGFAGTGGTVIYLRSVTAWEAGMNGATGDDVLARKLLPRFYGAQTQGALATHWTTGTQRWQSLFGHHLVLAEDGADWMLCLRPGLLGRLLIKTNGLWGSVALREIFPSQAWRDGYFLGGTPLAVEAALDAAPLEAQFGRDIFSRVSPDGAFASIPDFVDDGPVQLLLKAAPGLPVDIYLPDSAEREDGMLYPIRGAEPAAIRITATSPEAARAFFQWDDEARDARDLWLRHLPVHGEAGDPSQTTVLLDGVQHIEQHLVPEWGEVWRWDADAKPQAPGSPGNLPVYPMAWNGARGWSAPLLGPLVGVHFAEGETMWSLTSNEPLMARAAAWRFDGAGQRAVLLIQMDARRAAEIYGVPGMWDGKARAAEMLLPLLEQLGQVELWGRLEDRPDGGSALHFSGYLDMPAEDAS